MPWFILGPTCLGEARRVTLLYNFFRSLQGRDADEIAKLAVVYLGGALNQGAVRMGEANIDRPAI